MELSIEKFLPADDAERSAPVDVLLVDDQPKNLVALEAILADLGQNLVTATSGKAALRQVLARDFAVILLDVQMPDMDGYETATLIRQRSANRHTPIIFLTASHHTETQTGRGYDLGAVDYLFKPLDAAILRSKVRVFIELAKQSALLRKLADKLEQKNRELAEANKEIEAFSYSVSHDLRAPLRAIDGFAEALLEDYLDKLDDTGKKYLTYVRESAQHMGELIDGLLSLARVTRSELHRQPIDLSKIASDVGKRLRQQAPDDITEIEIQDGLTSDGDPRLLAAALDNLIGNAWKFTRKSARQPRIEVGKEVRGDQTTFYVRDNGIGFDMQYADKLFGVFQRLHAASEYDGHGIGLATVQRIIRRHGGRIWAEGQVGHGATFHFTLEEEDRT